MEKSQFRAPEYASELLSKVNSRCEKLVKTGVWDFNMSRLRGWVNNFRNSEEQYLCAHLLDSLMYRSDRMADSLCRHAVHSVLPNSMSTYPESLEIWRRALEGSKEITTLFVAVEGIKNGKKQAAKSGQRVLRQYHSSGAVNRNHFVDASYLLEKISGYPVERIVYIDDFCGTGRQFKDFYTHYELRKIPSDIEQYYVPFACHTEAVNSTFQKDITGVIARPVEMLSSNSAFFIEKNGTFRGDNHNSVESAKQFYLHMLESRGMRFSEPFGFGSLELTYGFSSSTPNNTLPIFYTKKSGWQPLLIR